VPTAHSDQEFAAVSVVQIPSADPVLALVQIGLAAKESRHGQRLVTHASALVVSDTDSMAEALEALYVRALPAACASARRAGVRSVWLGGDGTITARDPLWRERVAAVGSVMGLDIKIAEEPARNLRSLRTGLGSTEPPDYLFVWEPMARGAEPLLAVFQRLSPHGVVIQLAEPALGDALIEARLTLVEMGLADTAPTMVDIHDRSLPVGGEERHYVKVGGSKTGDVLIDVPDCGHEQWGSDARRKAPRATMGVERLEGVRPIALFRCAKCSKHRWRARF
jgi:hypothetical protein